jgi:hypothetical protein
MANNKLKYWRLDAKSRDALRARWNQPSRWPLWSALVLVLLSGFWLWRVLQKKEACSR